jgi:hypothetical protein
MRSRKDIQLQDAELKLTTRSYALLIEIAIFCLLITSVFYSHRFSSPVPFVLKRIILTLAAEL